jgi:uncharacterized protein GlcG (DUF336 family)
MAQRYRDARGRLWASLTQNNPGLWGNAAGIGYGVPMLPARGSLPITVNGVLVGGIGASGGPAQEDENAVRAGLVAVGLE